MKELLPPPFAAGQRVAYIEAINYRRRAVTVLIPDWPAGHSHATRRMRVMILRAAAWGQERHRTAIW
jgi:hypothetical protein